MTSIDGIYFLLIILGILILIALILAFVIKVRRGWLWIILMTFVCFGMWGFWRFLADTPFYRFERELRRDYPEIEKMDLSLFNEGLQYNIFVSLDRNEDGENAETIFVEMMRRINQEPFSGYLKRRNHTRWFRIQISFLEIPEGNYLSESYPRAEWFTESQRNEQNWKNTDNHKEYQYHDYAP